MSAPDFQTDPLAWLQYYAGVAENDLRFSCAADHKNRLPDATEKVLAATPKSPEEWLRRYQFCRAEYRIAHERQNAGTQQGDAEADRAGFDLLARTPVTVVLESGRKVDIRAKSVAAYSRMGELWHAVLLLDEAIAARAEQRRLSDLGLLRRAIAARDAAMNEMLAIALHPDPTPPADATPPDWSAVLTPADLTTIQRAHIAVGHDRYIRLPDPHALDSNPDPARTGFGFFVASIAKSKRMRPEQVLREDWWALLTELRLGAEAPSPAPSDDEGLEGLL